MVFSKPNLRCKPQCQKHHGNMRTCIFLLLLLELVLWRTAYGLNRRSETSTIYISCNNVQLMDSILKNDTTIKTVHIYGLTFDSSTLLPIQKFCSKIVTLRIRNCKNVVIPYWLGNLVFLDSLDLSGSSCSEYENIGNSKGLKYLNLTGTYIRYIPDSFRNLVELRYFILGFNRIRNSELDKWKLILPKCEFYW